MKISIIGAGYVGLVTAACFSEFGYEVICIDKDKKKIKQLERNIIPIYEPGLYDLVKKNRNSGNLSFGTNIEDTKNTDIIFIAVGTPTLRRGEGEADLKYVYTVCKDLCRILKKKSKTIIITKSTVPIGTGKKIIEIIQNKRPDLIIGEDFNIASNPEFLREGSAIEDFMRPDRVVCGVLNKFSQDIDIQDLSLFWQLTLKTLEDLKIINNDTLALEMYILQLTHLFSIEKNDVEKLKTFENNFTTNENIPQKTKSNNEQSKEILSNNIKEQLKNTDQLKEKFFKDPHQNLTKSQIEIQTFTDLIKLATFNKEYELKYDLERNVKLVSFSKGKINISFSDKLNKNFIKNLTEKLKLWTGERWIISLSKEGGAKSVFETKKDNKELEKTNLKNSKIAEEIFKKFPDASIEDIID